MKGKSKNMTEDERRDELFAKFQETDEMQDWDAFVTEARKALAANPKAELVTVPAAFLRRTIEDIGGAPLMFSANRDRFNLLCDELGLPEEKKNPQPSSGAGKSGDEVF
jgi:hypothetical protein